ncbi:hypothetical protein C7212DRAFT_350886 [Tuber magnatum]|uniref:Uncharacterized protein n=1 Tax=Tuber magnatum TaxID=42249 RepID=A0A317STJ2_9PEZI|nr:hypothetical protein C7212DRAFT_350886 [Tuber magnatum]
MRKQKPLLAKALYRAAASLRFLAEDVRTTMSGLGRVLDRVLRGLLDGNGKEGVEREVVERCGRTLDAVVVVVDMFLGEEGGIRGG